ncbi:hypothetical protein [Actinokineospora xionganensis]|uniref:Response regulatory domain-containing protein n=1 Tax=Actinokineospora xionganensis TaxID=2684470 RepID=A0ABR7KZK6_9PSEU|nr:hypothetical protein [Actinokineospora xionganensis]MBC6445809.1 hypothetical protein [Actinokineospora xionganensis]
MVAEAENAADLLRAVGEHRPDIAVLDIRMPPTDETAGIEAAVRIRAEYPGVCDPHRSIARAATCPRRDGPRDVHRGQHDRARR